MTRTEAMRRLKGLFGDTFKCVVADGLSSPEKRAEARRRFEEAEAAARDLEHRIEVQFGAEKRALQHQLNHACSGMKAYKFEVLTRFSVGWQPRAKGDTGEEVFAQLEQKRDLRALAAPEGVAS